MKPKMPKFPTWGGNRHAFQVYKARDGWRWRLWARNGRLVAESGESYKHRGFAARMAKQVRTGFTASILWV